MTDLSNKYRILLLLSWALIWTSGVHAQAVGKFTVEITGITDKRVLQNARQAVELYQRSLTASDKKPVIDYEWQRLLEVAPTQLQNAVKPYGYYKSQVVLAVEEEFSVKLAVTPGEPVIITRLNINIAGSAGELPEIRQWRAKYPLQEGSRLVQPDYDDAKADLTNLLSRFGYFDARFSKHAIQVDATYASANIELQVDSGLRYHYGDYRVVWRDASQSDLYSPQFVSQNIPIKAGDAFHAEQLQRVQSRLSGSGYYSYAEVRPLIDKAEDGVVPLQVTLQAPKRYAYGAKLGFGTDTGPRGGVNFEDRRFNRKGHRITSGLDASQAKQSLVASYIIPGNGKPIDNITIFTSWLEENSDVRDSRTLAAGFDFNINLNEHSQVSYGLSFRDEQFTESGITNNNQLLLPSLSWQTVLADDLKSPDRGVRVSAKLSGASEDAGSDLSFLQMNINAKAVYRLGSGRLLGRVELGQTFIASDDTLPTSFSYLAGGDYSVRGYGFETIGVDSGNGDLRGGENRVSASIEYEQQIRGPFSLAAFVDAGDAYDDRLDLKLGVGLGVRWRLPFGAIRLDLAQAQDLPGKPSRIHFTFGTDL